MALTNAEITAALDERDYDFLTVAMNVSAEDNTYAFIRVAPEEVPGLVRVLMDAYDIALEPLDG